MARELKENLVGIVPIEKITTEPFDDIIGHSECERVVFTIENKYVVVSGEVINGDLYVNDELIYFAYLRLILMNNRTKTIRLWQRRRPATMMQNLRSSVY